MRKIVLAAAGFAALAGAAGLALAQADAPPRGPFGMFQADANNDGAVTRAEFDAGRDAHFARLDANNDGALSQDEMQAMRGHHRGGRGGGMHSLRGADANNDGNITRDEFLARPIEHFDRLDANDDGVISAAERPQRPERGDRAGRGARAGHRGLDANNDGQISRAEFAAMGAGMFDRLDANGDGRVTREEAQAARPHHRERE
jgi:Ca2+-binding EF-hand superfamily protein